MKKEIPVYLFTGFLGAGKTTFIQDTLESEDFLTEECTLFLVCEEGEVEYEPEKFFDKDIHIEVEEKVCMMFGAISLHYYSRAYLAFQLLKCLQAANQ